MTSVTMWRVVGVGGAPKLDLSDGPRWACCGRNRLQNDHESAVCLPPVTSNVVRGWVLTKVPELIGGGPERLAHLLQPKPVVHKQGTESQYLLPPKMKVRRVHFDWDS